MPRNRSETATALPTESPIRIPRRARPVEWSEPEEDMDAEPEEDLDTQALEAEPLVYPEGLQAYSFDASTTDAYYAAPSLAVAFSMYMELVSQKGFSCDYLVVSRMEVSELSTMDVVGDDGEFQHSYQHHMDTHGMGLLGFTDHEAGNNDAEDDDADDDEAEDDDAGDPITDEELLAFLSAEDAEADDGDSDPPDDAERDLVLLEPESWPDGPKLFMVEDDVRTNIYRADSFQAALGMHQDLLRGEDVTPYRNCSVSQLSNHDIACWETRLGDEVVDLDVARRNGTDGFVSHL